jgi:N-methylhydantoinase B
MRIEAIELEIFKRIYHSIAEEMGAALRRTAFSPIIKERRD